jgi:hypothetical protein
MATRVLNERDVILSEMPCDPQRIEAVLWDWGLDEATVTRLLREHSIEETRAGEARPTTTADAPRTHIVTGKNKGVGGTGRYA